jgi:hypothetical protein
MRVVPSQVVAFIDAELLNAASDNPALALQPELTVGDAPRVAVLAELLRAVPDELLIMNAAHQAQLFTARAAIERTLAVWQSGNQNVVLTRLNGFTPVSIVRQRLSLLHDEVASSTHELMFIADRDHRARLSEDIAAVEKAVISGEWKAATVLGGSVIEALLLWALRRNEAAARGAASAAGADLRRWDLVDYLNVARELHWISDNTYAQATLARGFRNLIHPGVEERVRQRSDRSTAFAAVSGMDRVVRDIAEQVAAGR